MRRFQMPVLLLIATATGLLAQDETSHSVAGGGVTAPGWTGKVDASEAGKN